MTTRGVTEDYERQLWEELNALLADAVPAGASEQEAERIILLAVTGHDTEIADLYWRVRRLASDGGEGYLRDRLGEDNPISAVGRKLVGQQA